MIPLGDALGETLRRMGLPEPALMAEVVEEWETLAGAGWSESAVPLYVKDRVLVVEAREPSAVGLLRYGVGELERALQERFGAEVIAAVEIRAPQRRPRGRR